MSSDIYFTPEYGESAAIMEDGAWHCLSGPDIELPYVMRPVNDDCFDIVSPYGYSGIYVGPGCSPSRLAEFWADAVSRWRDAGIVSAFMRFSPMELPSVQAVQTLGTIRLMRRGDTVLLSTGYREQDLWKGMDSTARNRVRKAQKAGLTAHVRQATPADVAEGSPFRTLYTQTMRRVGSSPKYFFGDSYYTALVSRLGPNLQIAESSLPDGTVVAAALLMRYRDRLHYHLGASHADAIGLGCNNLLFWTFIQWADSQGMRLVHLGGGVAPNDNLLRYKKTFGGYAAEFWTGEVIIDQSRYAALLNERARHLGIAPGQLEQSPFFPAYRAGRP